MRTKGSRAVTFKSHYATSSTGWKHPHIKILPAAAWTGGAAFLGLKSSPSGLQTYCCAPIWPQNFPPITARFQMNAELRIVFVTGVTQILYEPAPKISEKCRRQYGYMTLCDTKADCWAQCVFLTISRCAFITRPRFMVIFIAQKSVTEPVLSSLVLLPACYEPLDHL